MVCAPPECIKSLLLKFIEQLHSLEEADMCEVARIREGIHFNGTMDVRDAAELRMMVEKLQGRSEMADAVIPILTMFEEGVLIMDEVDVLLHPLRR